MGELMVEGMGKLMAEEMDELMARDGSINRRVWVN